MSDRAARSAATGSAGARGSPDRIARGSALRDGGDCQRLPQAARHPSGRCCARCDRRRLGAAARQRRPAAFTAVELWLREGGRIERSTLGVAELAAWARQRGPGSEAALARRLERLTRPPSWPAGLPDRRPLIMGVVNVTPDSFSDGGRFLMPADAIARGREQHAAGADVVDVGGESTRPGAAPVPAAEEIGRVVPVIEALAARGILVSIDTRKAAVMRAAIAAGARMINDVTALRHDPDSMARGRRQRPAGGADAQPGRAGDDAAATGLCVRAARRLRSPRASAARPGSPPASSAAGCWSIPASGSARASPTTVEILSRLGLYLGLGVPLLLGVSRKSFIARLAGEAPAWERLPGSLAAALAGVAQGVAMLRVHEVAATREALRVWQALHDYD